MNNSRWGSPRCSKWRGFPYERLALETLLYSLDSPRRSKRKILKTYTCPLPSICINFKVTVLPQDSGFASLSAYASQFKNQSRILAIAKRKQNSGYDQTRVKS
ncbi:MAG: hypothetical protein KME21_27985 [Desmonostoc vinosum HA7617-LM4]|jgi:hypothetical protein|nr:hypothetical protein [Desmonostoc vinosum HA7617-LM4]